MNNSNNYCNMYYAEALPWFVRVTKYLESGWTIFEALKVLEFTCFKTMLLQSARNSAYIWVFVIHLCCRAIKWWQSSKVCKYVFKDILCTTYPNGGTVSNKM